MYNTSAGDNCDNIQKNKTNLKMKDLKDLKTFLAISPFVTIFSKVVFCSCIPMNLTNCFPLYLMYKNIDAFAEEDF